MGKEAYDDYKRNLRDREAKSARFLVLASGASSSSDEKGLSHSLLEGHSRPRAPFHLPPYASATRLAGEKPAGTGRPHPTAHIRLVRHLLHPHQPTDWKLRVAVPVTQKLPFDHELLNLDAEIYGVYLKADCTTLLPV